MHKFVWMPMENWYCSSWLWSKPLVTNYMSSKKTLLPLYQTSNSAWNTSVQRKMFVCERPRDCPREKYNLQNTKNSNKNLRITYEQFTSFQILNFHEFISVELPLQINHQSGLHNDNNFNTLTGQPSSIHFHYRS